MVQDINYQNMGQDPYKNTGNKSLLSKYDIPITHLDFSYIDKCTDGKELEHILHILKSGEEGYYPELMTAVENKLRSVFPKSKHLRKLSQVLSLNDLENEVKITITNDLCDWVSEISENDNELEKKKGLSTVDNKPKVRKMMTISTQEKQIKSKKIASTDYDSWDKYDPDTEILKMELEEEKKRNQNEQLKNQSVEKDQENEPIYRFNTEAENLTAASTERQKGNEYYRAGEYEKALIHYTTSMEYKATVACLNNRALTFLKMNHYDNALNDCDEALAIDPKNEKAIYRKAQTLNHLKRYEESLKCIEYCIRINPNNKDAQNLADNLRQHCVNKKIQKRLIIEDIQSNHQKRKEGTRIYKRHVEKPQRVIIPIPGTSKMPEPFFIECKWEDVEYVQNKINNRPHPITYIGPYEEEDCTIDHFSQIRSRNKDIPNNTCASSSGYQMKYDQNDNEILKTNSKCASVLSKKFQKIHLNDRDAGGDGMGIDATKVMSLPEELHLPYTFLKTWKSVGNDTSYEKYAHIINNMSMEQLRRVVGIKLDNEMLSIILKTLVLHFTVPGKVEKVYSVLDNIIRLPRFEIISMLMSEQDRHAINILIGFLNQHDKKLPDNLGIFTQCEKI